MKEYLNAAISISNLVRSTLGPRGMNKMVLGNQVYLTNDGATIIKNVKLDNPIGDIFKKLAESQEDAVGDGTTTTVLLAGQLLEKANELIQKNVHKTTIINGFNLAKQEALRFISSVQFPADKDQIIRTCFGSKIAKEYSDLLVNLIKDTELENLKILKRENSDPLNTRKIKGFAFEGFTINDRVPKNVEGNVSVLDFQTDLEIGKIQINSSDELGKMSEKNREYRKQIVNKLIDENVKCVFYSDTNPEFEGLLTENKIMGIVVYDREKLDNLCRAANCVSASSIETINVGRAKVKSEKFPNTIYVESEKSEIETLIVCGSTNQVLEEIERAILDVVGLMRHIEFAVYGGGSIEVDLSLHLEEFSKHIGGKEQLAIRKFAEALESIPLILAENCGLDSIEVLTALRTMHQNGQKMGVDELKIVSDCKERGLIEPSVMKMHSIISATDVANLILKLDEILVGNEIRNEPEIGKQ